MRKIITASVSLLSGLGVVSAITIAGAPAAHASALELCNQNSRCLVNNGPGHDVTYVAYELGTAWNETASGEIVTGSGQCASDGGVGTYLTVESCVGGPDETFTFEADGLIKSESASSGAGNNQCLITEGDGGIGNFACKARPAAEWFLVPS
jgi:hypothetical protein